MAIETLNNGESGLSIRNKINENFKQKANSIYEVKTKTASHVLDSDDLEDLSEGKTLIFDMNIASDNTFTLPSNASLAIPIGSRFGVRRIGAGLTTITPGSGATATGSSGGLVDPGANVISWVEKTATNTWLVDNGSPGAWKAWTPSFTGFSVNPSTIVARYSLIGKTCHVSVSMGTSGTSSATTFTITLPFAAANTAIQSFPAMVMDNGTIQTSPGRIDTTVNSTVANIYKTYASGAWTGTPGNKRAWFSFTYEIA